MKSYLNRKALIFFLVLNCAVGTVTWAAPQRATPVIPKKVLFIGNSYTSQVRKQLLQMLRNSPYRETTLRFITKGGAKLKEHRKNETTLQVIKNGNWDYVVLQEQSQTPAIGGRSTRSFHASVDALSEWIKESGAQPVLYMTWGRRDGDRRNKMPTFANMQSKLRRAYTSAAKRNNTILAPVGEAWAVVRDQNKDLGDQLFASDGSHPSNKGAYLTACVFFRVLFNDSLAAIQSSDSLTDQEWQVIKNAALKVEIQDYSDHQGIRVSR